MDSQVILKETLSRHLRGGEAFLPIQEVLGKISFSDLGKRPNGLPYSFYELFFHIRFTQKDILDYCLKKDYEAPVWPEEYWPAESSPENQGQWEDLQETYFRERETLEAHICRKDTDLLHLVPSSKNHTLLREVILVIEHTAYHSGQLLILLRHLGHYPG